MCDCVLRILNAFHANGTTAFERVFLAQKPWGSAESIRAVVELCEGEPDFKIEDVRPNVDLALKEHPRLSQIISERGLWTNVPVDLTEHIVDLTSLGSDMWQPVSGSFEEPPALLEVLSSMPAFKLEGRPLWQLVVTPRKMVFDIHHGLVDGVGVAVITATLFEGTTLEEANEKFCELARKRRASSKKLSPTCYNMAAAGFEMVTKLPKYLLSPLTGLVAPEPESAVFSKAAQGQKTQRLIHLGPYAMDSVKRIAKQRQDATLNGILFGTIASGIRVYCRNQDGDNAAVPTRCAIPFSFKAPHPNTPSLMRANNSFSTLLTPVDERGAFSVSIGEALAARNAQAALSFLPLPIIRLMYTSAARTCSYVFSNVDGTGGSGYFTSIAATSCPRRVRIWGYGAPPADVGLFVLVASHGVDLHISITTGQQIKNPCNLADAIDAAVRDLIKEREARIDDHLIGG